MGKLSNEKNFDNFIYIKENLKYIQENINLAALKAGKKAEDITLLGVTKTVEVLAINYAISLGLKQIGENKVQEWRSKKDFLQLSNCSCQFIGHLQTNKVKYLIGNVNLIQSVDCVELAEKISKISFQKNITTNILIEVNIGKEQSKFGIYPEKLEELCYTISVLKNIQVCGLMAIPPMNCGNLQKMENFAKLYHYFIDIKGKKIDNVNMNILSMGMSNDYTEAILSGSTMIRVGTALFGKRSYNC